MTTTTISKHDLETSIQDALIKIQSNKESDLCRYLPGKGEGHMHYLSFHHLKRKNPKEVQRMLDSHILSAKKLEKLPAPPKATRGSNKSGRQLKVSRELLERVVTRLQKSGDQDLLSELEPMVTSKTQILKNLRAAISAGIADDRLWEAFKKHVAKQL